MTVPARGSVEYSCTVHTHGVGPCEAEILLFLEDNGVREVTLRVRGTVAPGARDDDLLTP